MKHKKREGFFITFEGGEGSGKSTAIRFAASYLRKKFKTVGDNTPVQVVREPGSTRIGEMVRQILLDSKNTKMTVETELFLYLAARAQLVKEVIQPALQKGAIVICDRFEDSTIVYQGYAGGFDISELKLIAKRARGNLMPDMTLLLDVDVKTGLKRSGRKDRMEHKPFKFHERIRRGYLSLAKANPKRFSVIPANGSKSSVESKIKEIVDRVFS
jgi:dTMP kinase